MFFKELDKKVWCELLDEFLGTGKITGDPGILEEMSSEQKFTVNEIKKSLKRLNK